MRSVLESFDLLKILPIANFKVVTSKKDLGGFSFPCFLKIDSAEHKTEIGGVLKCNSFIDAEKNLSILQRNFPDKKVILQEHIDGIEMIIGIKEDAVFGNVLMIGAGGIGVEIYKDISFRVLPVSRKDIDTMFQELKIKEIVKRKKVNFEKFLDIAEKVSKLKISELDLNPVIVNEKGAWIVDARSN
jgi:hypothetical protein